ncbi:MAG: hypothetical protein Q7T07_21105 [Burkholderiaceae bacterium]|nr:hypothetical protein [Burkholderiaceae bacterium]
MLNDSDSEAVAAYTQLWNFFEHEKQEMAYSKIFSSNRIFDLAGGIAITTLAKVIGHLVTEGVIDQIVRVEPAYGQGIGDFDSIEDVPEILDDWRNPGNVVHVQYDHLKIYYKLHMNAAS